MRITLLTTLHTCGTRFALSLLLAGAAISGSLLAGTEGEAMGDDRLAIRKLGTIDCDLVETTPVVFHERLYRYEYVRDNYKPNKTGTSYSRFVDVATGKVTPSFAVGYHLGSAYEDQGRMYVYAVEHWGKPRVQVFWSDDLQTWRDQPALVLPGWAIYNTSVCRGPDRYIMAFEVGEPLEVVGQPFTMRFAESDDLLNWRLLPEDRVFSKDRYTACPTLRFLDGLYYMIYLEARPGPTYEPHIVRSPDLVHWQSSPLNPMMQFSDEDKRIANPALTPEQRQLIAEAVNLNNSDVDLCEFGGEVIIYYSWGNQQGLEFLAEAKYAGTLESFLKAFYPE
ncbi:MAG: hypothetical protein AB7W28_10305 [Armatimonadota bacterium]